MDSDTPLPSPPLASPTAGTQKRHKRARHLLARFWKQPLRSSIILGAATLIAVAGAPLVGRVWGIFWDLPHSGRVVMCSAGLTVIIVATMHQSDLQWNRWRHRATEARLGSLIALAWTVVFAAVALMVTGAWWVMGGPTLDFPETMPLRTLDALATRAFAIVAGLGGAALLVIHYRRQRTTEATSEREASKLFTETFDSASDKLGNEHAAVRLAGVHSLARLADEAPQGREDLVQMVIDVLCAYLRMPYTPAPAKPTKYTTEELVTEYREQELEYASLREVRHTIIRVIGDRLRWPTRWRGKHYDFTGVVFDGGSLSGAVFNGSSVSFQKAQFIGGEINFSNTKFTAGIVSFHKAHFQGGEVNFMNAEFSGGKVNFLEAEFSGGDVIFLDAQFTGGKVKFPNTAFTGGNVSFYRSEISHGELSFDGAECSGGRINFSKAQLAGGKISFHKTRFTGALVDFLDTEFSGGETSFLESEFSGRKVEFVHSKFTGSEVGFHRATFLGAEVNFVSNELSNGRLDFQFASGTPPFNLIESIMDAPPELIITPIQWWTNPTEFR